MQFITKTADEDILYRHITGYNYTRMPTNRAPIYTYIYIYCSKLPAKHIQQNQHFQHKCVSPKKMYQIIKYIIM